MNLSPGLLGRRARGPPREGRGTVIATLRERANDGDVVAPSIHDYGPRLTLDELDPEQLAELERLVQERRRAQTEARDGESQ